MALIFNIEADGRLSRDEMKNAISACDVSIVAETDSDLRGNFRGSNMFFLFRDGKESFPREVLAESVPFPLSWAVGCELTLEAVTKNYDKCCDEIFCLLLALENSTRANFVLSFQYEDVYAIRSEEGLRIYKELRL